MDREVFHFGIFKTPDQTGVETNVRINAAIHPVVPSDDVHRSRHRNPCRVSAFSRVLAAHP